MDCQEGLRRARAVRQQLQLFVARRAQSGMYQDSSDLRVWAIDRKLTPQERRPPMPAALQSVLEELVRLLAESASMLLPIASGPAPMTGTQTTAFAACCAVLNTLLLLCTADLRLADADALRLLTAGGLPLQAGIRGRDPAGTAELLGVGSAAVESLVVAYGSTGGLPLRAAAAARRTALRPQAFCDWVIRAVVAFADLDGRHARHGISDLLSAARAICYGVDGAVALLPELAQCSLVSMAAAGMDPPANEVAAGGQQQEQAGSYEPSLLSTSVSMAFVLPHGRLLYGQQTGGALLPKAVAALSARCVEASGQQAQQAQQVQHGAAQREMSLEQELMLLMTLISSLVKDASTADAEGSPAHPILLRSTISALPSLLAVLHQLGDLADAAAEAARSGDDEGDDGQADSFAARLLLEPGLVQVVFETSLTGLVDALAHLDALKDRLPGWSGDAEYTAAVTAADRGLRLLTRLWGWPVARGGAGRPQITAPAHAVPASGLAGMSGVVLRNVPQALGLTLTGLSFTLCATAANSEVCDDAATLAAFRAAMAACKWEWWQAGQADAGAFFPAELAGEPTPLPMHPACLAAQRALQRQQWALRGGGGNTERAAEIQRRLDCILLTYIEALTARPAGMSAKDVVQPRMLALANWSDWQADAAGTDLVVADGCRGARLLMQTFADALADRTCPNRIAIGTLNWVLQRSQPSLLPVAAATPDLLRQLARLVAQPSLLGPPNASIRNTAQPDLFSIASSLLKWLQQSTRQHQAAAGGSSGRGGGGGSSTVSKLLAAEVDTAANEELADLLRLCSRSPLPEAALQMPQPVASADDLALRRARALALRACGNPSCTKLTGDSEAAVKGRRCSGCRLVRYCCEGCSRQDWKAHKRACRLLSQRAAE